MAPRGQAQQYGFTLLEVIIAVAIVAILAAIAVASYQNYVIRANRSAAQQFMSSVSNREEQVLLDLRQYVAVTANANFPSAPTAGLNVAVPTEVSQYYNVSVTRTDGPPPTYLIKGVPISTTMQKSDHTLYLNSAGQKWRDFDGNTTFDPGTDVDWNAR